MLKYYIKNVIINDSGYLVGHCGDFLQELIRRDNLPFK